MGKTVCLIKYQPENFDRISEFSDSLIEKTKHDIEKWLGPRRIQNGLTVIIESKDEKSAKFSIDELGINNRPTSFDKTGRRCFEDITHTMFDLCQCDNIETGAFAFETGAFVKKTTFESYDLFKSLFKFELLDEAE